MNNEYFDFAELQSMKEQISILKGKLDKEAVVNDALIRKVLSEKADKLKIMGWGKTVVAFLSIPLMVWCCSFLGMSLNFTVVRLSQPPKTP